MKPWAILASCFLAGCAGSIDAATKANTAFANLTSAFNTDIDLESALLKDISWKSAQLHYVSKGQYSCGDPDDPYTRMATKIALTDKQRAEEKKKWDEKKEITLKSLRKKYAALEVIVSYGEALASLTKSYADNDAIAAKLQTSLDNYKPFASGEVILGIAAFQNAIGLIRSTRIAAESAHLQAIARSVDRSLADAEKKLTGADNLKLLTADEALAFSLWDSCALERLVFLRDFFPPDASKKTANRYPYLAFSLRGESGTPVLSFAYEYKAYLEEREKFVGTRPDFKGLIHAIVVANHAIAYPTVDAGAAIDELGFLGSQASSARDAYEKFRKSLEKFRNGA